MTLAINALILDKKKTGIGNYAYSLIKEMEALNTDIKMDIYMQRHMIPEFQETRHMHYIACPDFMRSRERILFEQWRLPTILKQSGCEVVHYFDYHTPLRPIPAKMIVTIHDLSYYKHPAYFTFGRRVLKQSITALSLGRAEKVLCVSTHTKMDVYDKFPKLDRNKVKAIPLGVKVYDKQGDLQDFSTYMKEIGINGKYILYIGTLEPRKNVELLIRAYQRAVSKASISHQLLLCGKPGWKYQGIFDAAKEMVPRERIVFGGYAPEQMLPLLYKNAEAFVYPSWYEGFGLPPLEAMACGAPVLSSNASSLPEAVGDAALLFSPVDEEGLADLLIRVIEEKGLKEELRERGLRQAAKFSWTQTAQQTLNVYRELLLEGAGK